VIDCNGLVVTAGFWNSDVHILTPGLLRARELSSEHITAQLQAMFARWGFTTVFYIAFVLENTTLIRRRIESGEVKGPRILSVGEPFWGKEWNAHLRQRIPGTNHINIPDVGSSPQATARVRQQIRDGANGIKVFVHSIEADGILTIPLDLAKRLWPRRTAPANLSLPMFPTIKESKSPFRAVSISWPTLLRTMISGVHLLPSA
jgi:hypothetical protein